MKIKLTIVALLIVFCLSSSFQCSKCRTGDLLVGATRSWLPLKGRTQLVFVDSAGNLTNFKLHVVDTTEVAINDCGNPFKYDHIETTLYLNPGMSDSIYFSLGSGDWLCMRAISNNSPNIAMCNVFGETKEGIVAKKLSNQLIGNRTYAELILLLHNPGLSDNIDSLYIANNVGIVGFKYANRKYTLQ